MYDLLLFPGQLKKEQNHCLITPPKTSHPDYLQVGNALSEFDTEELKARARNNLNLSEYVNEKIEQKSDLFGTKLEVIHEIDEINELISEENKKISIYEVQRDQTKIKARTGDLVITAKYQNNDIEEENDSLEKPYITSNFNNQKVNIVFDNGDFELGVTDKLEIKTTYRSLKPVWLITEIDGGFKFKHLDSNLYLTYESNSCILSNEGTIFQIDVSDLGTCEILIDNKGLNMFGDIDKNIGMHDKGDANNKLHIIDCSKYKLPLFSDDQDRHYYSIEFNSSNLAISGIEGVTTQHYFENETCWWALVGTSDECKILNKKEQKYLDLSDIIASLSNNSTLFRLMPSGFNSIYNFELCKYSDLSKAINQYGYQHGNSTNISLYNRGDLNNILQFKLQSQDINMVKVISTNKATKDSDGLMSSTDKHKLDQLTDIDWIDVF